MAHAGCRPLRDLPNLPVLGRPPDASEFLERLFASVGDEPAFLAVLETLADWYGAGTMALNEFDHRTHAGRLVPVRGFGAPLMRAYMEHYAACNVWLLDADRKLRTGDLGVSHLLYPDALLVHTEWYTDFVRPQGVFHSMGAVIVCQDGRTITTPILREESAGNYTEDEQTVLRSLAPFLELAFRLHTRLLDAESYRAAACSLLDSLPTAVFFLDAEGKLVGLNAAARDMALQEDGLAVANGRLLFESRRVHATLSVLLRGIGPRAVDAAGATGTVLLSLIHI
jgi:PAS domain-containing protein